MVHYGTRWFVVKHTRTRWMRSPEMLWWWHAAFASHRSGVDLKCEIMRNPEIRAQIVKIGKLNLVKEEKEGIFDTVEECGSMKLRN